MSQGFINQNGITLPLPVAQGGTGNVGSGGFVALTGVTNASSAGAGIIGQVLSSSVATSSVSISNATAKTLTSISLTAGDWDVWGAIGLAPAGATVISSFVACISLTDNTQSNIGTLDISQMAVFDQRAFAAGLSSIVTIPTSIINVSSTTTVYLVVNANFTVSTCTAGGAIVARRVR